MAKRKQTEERIEPILPTDKAIPLLKEQINKVDSLIKLQYNDPEYDKWKSVTQQLIIKTFGKPHDNLNSFTCVISGPMHFNMEAYELQNNYVNALKERKALLEGFIEQLEKFGSDASPKISNNTSFITSRKVFIVHGHDEQAKTELALILTRLGFEPIILHEQANEGMTVIEKLEKYSDVGYAFVLLTPDDVGGKRGQDNYLASRARQNVVFEFGLFTGRLTRKRVCCLHSGDVELPSDLNGLVYIPFESSVNEKQLDIVKELRAAGYEVKI